MMMRRLYIALTLAAAAAVPTHLNAHKLKMRLQERPPKVAACEDVYGGVTDTDGDDGKAHCCPMSCGSCGGPTCSERGAGCCAADAGGQACSQDVAPPCYISEADAAPAPDTTAAAAEGVPLTNANMIPNGDMADGGFPGFLNDCATETSQGGTAEVSTEEDSGTDGYSLKLTSAGSDDYTLSYTTGQAANRCDVGSGEAPATVIQWACKAGETYELTAKAKGDAQGEIFLFNFSEEDQDNGVATDQISSGWVNCKAEEWTDLTAELTPSVDGFLRVRLDCNTADASIYFDDIQLVKTADPPKASKLKHKLKTKAKAPVAK